MLCGFQKQIVVPSGVALHGLLQKRENIGDDLQFVLHDVDRINLGAREFRYLGIEPQVMTDDVGAAPAKVVPNDVERGFVDELAIIRWDDSSRAGIARLVEQLL